MNHHATSTQTGQLLTRVLPTTTATPSTSPSPVGGAASTTSSFQDIPGIQHKKKRRDLNDPSQSKKAKGVRKRGPDFVRGRAIAWHPTTTKIYNAISTSTHTLARTPRSTCKVPQIAVTKALPTLSGLSVFTVGAQLPRESRTNVAHSRFQLHPPSFSCLAPKLFVFTIPDRWPLRPGKVSRVSAVVQRFSAAKWWRRGEKSESRASPFALSLSFWDSAADRGFRAPLVFFAEGPLNLRRKRLLDVELSSDLVGGFVCMVVCVCSKGREAKRRRERGRERERDGQRAP